VHLWLSVTHLIRLKRIYEMYCKRQVVRHAWFILQYATPLQAIDHSVCLSCIAYMLFTRIIRLKWLHISVRHTWFFLAKYGAKSRNLSADFGIVLRNAVSTHITTKAEIKMYGKGRYK
jgi:hypothetical protein